MDTTEIIFCKKCNEPAISVSIFLEAEVALGWNAIDSVYEIHEHYLDYEKIKTIICTKCLSSIIKEKSFVS
jgi:hypothetical protein